MPFVNVYYPENLLNISELQTLSQCIHRSLIDHFHVPEKDYFQLFLPYPANHLFYDPHYLMEDGEKRSDKMIHVSITCGPGRSVDQKRNLYHSIANAVSNKLNIPAADLFITLNETAGQNWSFGQGIAQLIEFKEEKKDE